ncbi:hypothetical protein E2C01_037086 [Portunus trituberculatus]|uniref:Uncharacterized protein n=1 Tax=Portunus trituberculatus TaxID=210409 RepID=A0A5B7FEF1_PORTR|nr:hypothetical protein [Portunus trituberculatus]
MEPQSGIRRHAVRVARLLSPPWNPVLPTNLSYKQMQVSVLLISECDGASWLDLEETHRTPHIRRLVYDTLRPSPK